MDIVLPINPPITKHLGITTLSKNVDGLPFWYVVLRGDSLISGHVTGDIDDLGNGHCITGQDAEDWFEEFNDVILPVSYKNACLMMRRYLEVSTRDNGYNVVWDTGDPFGEVIFQVLPLINKLDNFLR